MEGEENAIAKIVIGCVILAATGDATVAIGEFDTAGTIAKKFDDFALGLKLVAGHERH